MKKLFFLISIISIFPTQLRAQVVINSTGTPYTQDFDAPDGSGALWFNDIYSKSWYAYSNGSSNEFALGLLCSGSTDEQAISLRLKNNPGKTINALK